jgi:hypothetical protein
MSLEEMERWLSPNLAYWKVLMFWRVDVLKCWGCKMFMF